MKRKEEKLISWENDNISIKQKKYVEILSGYSSSEKLDKPVIEESLKKAGKKNISELTKKEAHELIRLLLLKPCSYLLPCNRTIELNKREANAYTVLGGFMACLHYCPEHMDLEACEFLTDYLSKLNDEYDNDSEFTKQPTVNDGKKGGFSF